MQEFFEYNEEEVYKRQDMLGNFLKVILMLLSGQLVGWLLGGSLLWALGVGGMVSALLIGVFVLHPQARALAIVRRAVMGMIEQETPVTFSPLENTRIAAADREVRELGYAVRQLGAKAENTVDVPKQERRRDFVADVSHELRSPLTSLSGFLETLQHGETSKRDRERALKIMQQQTMRMVRLVEDLLMLASLEDRDAARADSLVDLGETVRQELVLLQKQFKKRRLTLIPDVPMEPIWVLGEESRLAQIVRNLLDNAVKYGRKDSELRITVRLCPAAEVSGWEHDAAQVVRLDVQDQGEGIAEQHLSQITDRFYRVDSHRSREYGGTGLGLAIVEQIVTNYRGALRIESTPGVGSCFSVLLPGLEVGE